MSHCINKMKVKCSHGNNGGPVLFLEFPESTAIDDASNNVSHVKWLPRIRADYSM